MARNAYFAADGLSSKLSTIEREGGAVRVPPREVPARRFAVGSDPQGAVFCLFEGALDP
jgi:predicted enzyme related to lactoylglutathione lyase